MRIETVRQFTATATQLPAPGCPAADAYMESDGDLAQVYRALIEATLYIEASRY